MTDHFFEKSNPLWYIACDGGLLHLAVLTFWPNFMPYESLGTFGQFTKYLAFNQHALLFWIFCIAMFLHVFEAILALRLCKKLNIDPYNTRRWVVQTFFLGYVSLGTLRKYAAKKQRKV